ncbi:MAG: hypothetical protein C9356_08625 [Oleiphilus sp.]|nr:MAG: hypothetical protein C9356_08625 [Oleiphilus sp.]
MGKLMTVMRLMPIAVLGFCMAQPAFSEMKALGDEVLSGVSGQSGITLDLEAKFGIEEAAYFEDGNGIALQGLRLNADTGSGDYAEFRILLDVLADGTLVIDMKSNNTARVEIEEIRFVDTPGVTPVADAPSIGGLFFDFNLDGNMQIRNTGNSAMGPDSIVGGVYDLDFLITDARLGYRTNGNEFFLDGMTLDVDSPGTILGATTAGELALDLPNFLAELSVDAIRYSNNPNNHGVTNDVDSALALPSYGSLWANLDMNSSWRARAGGRLGTEGLTINSQTTINSLDLAWGDDTDWAAAGYWAGALGITGQIDITNMTLDVLPDPDEGVIPEDDFGLGLALAFERIALGLYAQDIVLGVTKSDIDASLIPGGSSISSLGSFGVNLVFADGVYGGNNYTNRIYLQSGGNVDAGYQGLRLDTQLSIVGASNESNFIYTENGNSLMWSGFEAYADGDLTLDVTAQGVLGATEFYDGLRLGFEDFAFGYKVEGLRLAEDTGDQNDLKASELQAAHDFSGMSGGLFGLSGKPMMEGNLNGHITLGPGGNDGVEGVTINSDLALSQGQSALYIDEDDNTRGLWLSGLNYDVHLRDMMLDVTDEGLRIYESESWSKMDVTDFRIGDQVTGASFGRLMLETYEQGSVSTISAGGAGQVCIGGSGVDSAACTADGGRWEDRGDQGITVTSQRFFKDSIEAEGKRNRFTWETGRTGEGTASPQNGTGMQLVFDNFTTNDGDGLNDTYGFQTEQNVDVASAYVVKKADGPDSNGVVGNRGDVKVMNSDGSYRYVAPSSLTAQDWDDLPIGIATRTRTHFKELDFEQVNLAHPVGGESTLLYGLKLQNFDITTDITTTAMD